MAAEDKRRGAPSGPPGMGGPPPQPGMSDPDEKARDAKGTFRRLIAFMGPEVPKIALVLLCAVIGTCFDVFAPRELGIATTTIFEGATARTGVDFATLYQVLVIVLVLYLGSAAFTYVQMLVMARVTQNIVYRLRAAAESKLNRIPLSYFDAHPKGDVLSRVVNDVDLISSTLQDSLTQSVSAVITLVGVLVMMLVISPFMTLIALCTLPVSVLVTMFVAKRSQRFYLAQQASLGALDSHIEETYGGHTEVRSFGHEASAIAGFERINEEYFSHAWRAQFMTGLIRPIMNFIGNLAYVAVCVVGAGQVLAGAIGVGDIQAFAQYMRNFTRPIAQVAGVVNTIQATLAGAERIFELLDEPEMEELEDVARADAVHGAVEFEHVLFSYIPGKPVIKDFSVKVAPGQTVAIVGPTGAGKSTLVNLLMRFYEIDGGAIYLDGADIRLMSRRELRGHFGMVLQDTWLFNGSIRDNIAYGAQGASDEQVRAAARAAHVGRFIESLPQGYDTVVNEEASNISAGQRQLITIARAIIAKPEVMVLDEATSSIDTRTERLVQQAMRFLMKDCTSFVIAHRLSTIRSADLILVIKDGDIVEQGTHGELLSADGFYAELYNSQFADCIDELDS